MKRWLAALAITTLSVFGLGTHVFAATTPEVSGTVAFNGTPAANANVSISCAASGGGEHIRNLTASSTGHYNASFGAGQCNDGAEVIVVATSSDGLESGQASDVMGAGGTSQRVEIDVGLSAPTPLPEFIPVTIVAALFVAAGIVAIIRRRSNENFRDG
jgi:hypothetical protein